MYLLTSLSFPWLTDNLFNTGSVVVTGDLWGLLQPLWNKLDTMGFKKYSIYQVNDISRI